MQEVASQKECISHHSLNRSRCPSNRVLLSSAYSRCVRLSAAISRQIQVNGLYLMQHYILLVINNEQGHTCPSLIRFVCLPHCSPVGQPLIKHSQTDGVVSKKEAIVFDRGRSATTAERRRGSTERREVDIG